MQSSKRDAEPLQLVLAADVLAAVDAFAGDGDLNPDAPTRSEAVERIVRDWLQTHGLLAVD